MSGVVERIESVLAWLGMQATFQDLAKAIMLGVFVLIILMILGDVYRGEIQNTFHRIRVIPHRPANARRDPSLRDALLLPKYMVQPSLDGTYSNVLFYYRYRDHFGQLKTKPLHSYRVVLRIRRAFGENNAAPGQETDHNYTDDELSALEKERPYLDSDRPVSEIVSLSRSRAENLKEIADARMKGPWNKWSRLNRSKIRRWIFRVAEEDLQEPQYLGLVAKFHFPINPYFLLYKHPDTNVRSTAWLTVLTSVFALFMQIVFSPHPTPTTETRVTEVVRTSSSVLASIKR